MLVLLDRSVPAVFKCCPSTCLILFATVGLLSVESLLTGSEELSGDSSMLPRIGIIGGGISGASSAYFLRQLFGKDVVVDVFEAEKIGGRTAVVDINNLRYEAGGSIIHAKNRYMVGFAESLSNTALSKISHSAGFMGLFDTQGMRFTTSDWKPVTLAKLAWRYGLDLLTIQKWTSKLMDEEFDRIYSFQEKGMAFTTVEDMLHAMGDHLVNMTQHSMKDVLLDAGLSELFVSELAMAAARNNYGQTTENMHGFVGAVAMCGVESGLWSVQGGNYQIPIHLLKESGASVVKGAVTTVALIKGSGSVTYEVEYEQTNANGISTESREYDLIIVATPLEGAKMKIDFVDFPVNVVPFSQPYHNTVVLFVEGRINKTTFNIESVADFPPNLFTVSSDLLFNSIGNQSPVDPSETPDSPMETDHAVWKTFLNDVPTDEQIGDLFDKHKNVKIVNWKAYPEYKVNMDLPPFMLYDHLYYVNAVESAAAAMEMNVIGAKNVALLAFNQWNSHFDKIDELYLQSTDKTEL